MNVLFPGHIFGWAGSNASIPTGWERVTALDGYFPRIVGESDSYGDVGDTGGNATHTHTSPSHTHNISNHVHSITLSNGSGFGTGDGNAGGGGQPGVNRTHNHGTFNSGNPTSNSTESVAVTYSAYSNNPPYYELIFITPTSPVAGLPDDAITLVDGASIGDLTLCDGDNSTPNLTNKYLRGAGTSQDAGGTGGSLTNEHTITHDHDNTHAHSAVTSNNANANVGANTGGSLARNGHNHSVALNTSSTIDSDDNSSIGAQSETVEPPFQGVVVAQNQMGDGFVQLGIIALFLGDEGDVPDNWTILTKSGRFLKSMAIEDEGETGGSDTHTHGAQGHTHNIPSHTHTVPQVGHSADVRDSSGSKGYADTGTIHASSTSGGATATLESSNTTADSANNMPVFKNVLLIRLDATPGEESERDSEIHGKDSFNDEKDSQIHGKDIFDSEKQSEVHGIDNFEDEKSSEITGKDNFEDEKSSEITGKDNFASEISSEITGVRHSSDRASEITGVPFYEFSERASEITGFKLSTEIDSEIKGKDEFGDEKQSEVTGKIEVESEKQSEVFGKLDLAEEVSSEIHGKLAVDDQKDSEIHGVDNVSSEISSEVTGSIPYSERYSTIRGKAQLNIARTYRILVKDQDGNLVGEFSSFRSLKFSKRLNNYGEASFEVSVTDPKASALVNLRVYTVWIYRQENADSVLVWAGEQAMRDVTIDNAGNGWVTIHCYTWLEQLNSRYTAEYVEFDGVDAGQIAWSLIDTTQDDDDGDFGITEGTIEATVNRVRHYYNQNVMEAIINLANVISGFDFEITDEKVFNVASVLGEDKTNSVVLKYGQNISSVRITEDFVTPINRAIVLGQATDEDTLQRIDTNDTILQGTYKLREFVLNEMDISESTTFVDKGEALIRKYGLKLVKVEPELTKSSSVNITKFGLGDAIRLIVKYGVYDIDTEYRVFEWEVTYNSDNSENMSLVLGNFTL